MKSNTTSKNQPEKDMNILTDFKNLMKKMPHILKFQNDSIQKLLA